MLCATALQCLASFSKPNVLSPNYKISAFYVKEGKETQNKTLKFPYQRCFCLTPPSFLAAMTIFNCCSTCFCWELLLQLQVTELETIRQTTFSNTSEGYASVRLKVHLLIITMEDLMNESPESSRCWICSAK